MAIPVGNALAALPFWPRPGPAAAGSGRLIDEWHRLLALGATIMVTSSLGAGALVVIRALVIRQNGMEAAGLYQAAYSISALNASLVLSAMATDYFPRLSGTETDRRASATLVNQQLHAALLLASPILLGMTATAPLVLHILYSGEFTTGGDLLRWQLVGELFKLPGWALGFLLVARSDKKRFLLVETSFALVFIGATYALLPRFGLTGAGVAYALAYLLYSVLVAGICSRGHEVKVSRQNFVHMALVGAAMVALALIGPGAPWVAAGIGLLTAAMFGLHALCHLNEIRRAPTEATVGGGLQPE
jgi:PST family polysaccharide transporter